MNEKLKELEKRIEVLETNQNKIRKVVIRLLNNFKNRVRPELNVLEKAFIEIINLLELRKKK